MSMNDRIEVWREVEFNVVERTLKQLSKLKVPESFSIFVCGTTHQDQDSVKELLRGTQSIDILKIDGFKEAAQTAEGSQTISKYLAEANSLKSILNMVGIDKEDDYQRMSFNFAGLPEIQKIFLQVTSGATDIPDFPQDGGRAGGIAGASPADPERISMAGFGRPRVGSDGLEAPLRSDPRNLGWFRRDARHHL